MSEFANLRAEASGFVTDNVLVESEIALLREEQERTWTYNADIELDRGARIIQALVAELDRVSAVLEVHDEASAA